MTTPPPKRQVPAPAHGVPPAAGPEPAPSVHPAGPSRLELTPQAPAGPGPAIPQTRRRPVQREELEQRELVRWARLNEGRWPALALLFHVPNGGLRPKGRKRSGEAGKMVGLGAKSGVPDLCLPTPRGGYHGLWIEMKAGRNKPSEPQRWWIAELRRQGYRVEVCYAWHEARDVIVHYLGA